jgi:hypothetical protein
MFLVIQFHGNSGSILGRGKGFLLLHLCPVDTGCPFPGVKRGRDVTLTTHPI